MSILDVQVVFRRSVYLAVVLVAISATASSSLQSASQPHDQPSELALTSSLNLNSHSVPDSHERRLASAAVAAGVATAVVAKKAAVAATVLTKSKLVPAAKAAFTYLAPVIAERVSRMRSSSDKKMAAHVVDSDDHQNRLVSKRKQVTKSSRKHDSETLEDDNYAEITSGRSESQSRQKKSARQRKLKKLKQRSSTNRRSKNYSRKQKHSPASESDHQSEEAHEPGSRETRHHEKPSTRSRRQSKSEKDKLAYSKNYNYRSKHRQGKHDRAANQDQAVQEPGAPTSNPSKRTRSRTPIPTGALHHSDSKSPITPLVPGHGHASPSTPQPQPRVSHGGVAQNPQQPLNQQQQHQDQPPSAGSAAASLVNSLADQQEMLDLGSDADAIRAASQRVLKVLGPGRFPTLPPVEMQQPATSPASASVSSKSKAATTPKVRSDDYKLKQSELSNGQFRRSRMNKRKRLPYSSRSSKTNAGGVLGQLGGKVGDMWQNSNGAKAPRNKQSSYSASQQNKSPVPLPRQRSRGNKPRPSSYPSSTSTGSTQPQQRRQRRPRRRPDASSNADPDDTDAVQSSTQTKPQTAPRKRYPRQQPAPDLLQLPATVSTTPHSHSQSHHQNQHHVDPQAQNLGQTNSAANSQTSSSHQQHNPVKLDLRHEAQQTTPRISSSTTKQQQSSDHGTVSQHRESSSTITQPPSSSSESSLMQAFSSLNVMKAVDQVNSLKQNLPSSGQISGAAHPHKVDSTALTGAAVTATGVSHSNLNKMSGTKPHESASASHSASSRSSPNSKSGPTLLPKTESAPASGPPTLSVDSSSSTSASSVSAVSSGATALLALSSNAKVAASEPPSTASVTLQSANDSKLESTVSVNQTMSNVTSHEHDDHEDDDKSSAAGASTALISNHTTLTPAPSTPVPTKRLIFPHFSATIKQKPASSSPTSSSVPTSRLGASLAVNATHPASSGNESVSEHDEDEHDSSTASSVNGTSGHVFSTPASSPSSTSSSTQTPSSTPRSPTVLSTLTPTVLVSATLAKPSTSEPTPASKTEHDDEEESTSPNPTAIPASSSLLSQSVTSSKPAISATRVPRVDMDKPLQRVVKKSLKNGDPLVIDASISKSRTISAGQQTRKFSNLQSTSSALSKLFLSIIFILLFAVGLLSVRHRQRIAESRLARHIFDFFTGDDRNAGAHVEMQVHKTSGSEMIHRHRTSRPKDKE